MREIDIFVVRWSRRVPGSGWHVLPLEAELHSAKCPPSLCNRRISWHGGGRRERQKIHAHQHILPLALLHQLPPTIHPHRVPGRRIRGVSMPKSVSCRVCQILHRNQTLVRSGSLHLRAPDFDFQPHQAILFSLPNLNGAPGPGVLVTGCVRCGDDQHLGGVWREFEREVPPRAQCEELVG